MTTLLQLKDGKPVGSPVLLENFFTLFPDTSFPQPITPEDVEPYGFGLFEFTEQPTPGVYQKIVESAPQQDAQGIWHETWEIVDMTDQEKAASDSAKAKDVRVDRNRRLASCDWTQLGDAPVDAAEWALYRQNLRDITNQSGFPWEIVWPTEP